MPALDRLYQERKDRGFVVLGMSDESIPSQRKFLTEVKVTCPLLMLTQDVPSLYRDIARYPETFLVDREGRLQPAPDLGQRSRSLKQNVDPLLDRDSSRAKHCYGERLIDDSQRLLEISLAEKNTQSNIPALCQILQSAILARFFATHRNNRGVL
jgi:hypothetical protein